MRTTLLSLGTVTYALKARKLLGQMGIKAKLVKINTKSADGGCNHGIEIQDIQFYDAISILRSEGISYTVVPKKK